MRGAAARSAAREVLRVGAARKCDDGSSAIASFASVTSTLCKVRGQRGVARMGRNLARAARINDDDVKAYAKV